MKFGLGIAVAVLLGLAPTALAGDNDWESPVYNYFYKFRLPIPPVAEKKTTYLNDKTGIPIDFYEVDIRAFEAQVYPNLGKASLVGYDGISPGPTFRIQRGHETLIRFVNKYGRPSSIHLHGSYSRAPFDGWAEDVIQPGQYKDYYYPNNQEPRTMWYHDHAIHITALNAYYGQAGFYIIYDPKREAELGLPQGNYDIPLMIQSKRYQSNGALFSVEGETTSLYGDVIHVNGQPWPYLEVEPRKYRFRLVDASVSRAFRLSLVETGKTSAIPFTVVAADAGFLSRPITTSDLYISMAERYEIIVDFAPWKGKKLTLRNARDVMKDDDFAGTDRVMQFVVGNTVTDNSNNGGPLEPFPSLDLQPSKSSVDHSFRFGRTNSMWTINGVAFSDVKNRILTKPRRGSVELWELENNSGGWSHPVHIHLVDFQIISRSGGRSVQPYEAVALKDVVLLGPNEKVRVLARYAPWDGVYMFHCHNLVHEDHDMMAAFNVSVLEDFGYPETTRFIDPMEDRWQAKRYEGTNLLEIEENTLPFFSSLDAYAHVNEVQAALIEYDRTHVSGQSKTSTTTIASTSTSTTIIATTTATISSTSSPTTTPTTIASTSTSTTIIATTTATIPSTSSPTTTPTSTSTTTSALLSLGLNLLNPGATTRTSTSKTTSIRRTTTTPAARTTTTSSNTRRTTTSRTRRGRLARRTVVAVA